MNAPRYSADVALAALCLWEAVVAPDSGESKPWDETRENDGTCVLRDQILGMAALCNADANAAYSAGYDEPFDWEFAPAWLAHNYAALADGQRRDRSRDRAARLAWMAAQ